jgi:hypothetical protein
MRSSLSPHVAESFAFNALTAVLKSYRISQKSFVAAFGGGEGKESGDYLSPGQGSPGPSKGLPPSVTCPPDRVLPLYATFEKLCEELSMSF